MRKNGTSATDVEAGLTRKVIALQRKKAETARLVTLANDPDLNAYRIERQRRTITRWMWIFLVLGLGYSTTNVHEFVANGRTTEDPVWWAAWLVEPMAAGLLINLLTFESEVIARGIDISNPWVTRLKRTLLGATLFMSTWPQLIKLKTGGFNIGLLVVAALVPLVVFLVAEVMPVIQRYMRALLVAASTPAATSAASQPAAAAQPANDPKTLAALRLPPRMRKAIEDKASEIQATGRSITREDIQELVRVPDEMATQIMTALHPTNGHAHT
ncbi:hypothetical protein DMH04_30225 [Kibdelosporangium aridum]|uniref:DUF2637 domain-containing protein n=1 Tax=Kibdelosporangium aridum TaxID=2030 RepID=A0A428Z372_KIBAR|nr:hypothetical protein [Kibdelosporangium aridum]RSM80410.1 hypothetical protein DMH04_30225 [Kibdelosporangium aridum]